MHVDDVLFVLNIRCIMMSARDCAILSYCLYAALSELCLMGLPITSPPLSLRAGLYHVGPLGPLGKLKRL